MPSDFTNENEKLLLEVAKAFGGLLDQVVFLGGATTFLLVDKGAQVHARKTDDVDVIADLITRADYYRFSDELKKRGFREDQRDGAPLCRWQVDREGISYTVDVMPLAESVLGFTNRWYPEALKNTNLHVIGEDLEIRIVKPLFFLATKFEAYHGRFEGDYFSRDIEDIVCLLEHRKALVIELLDAPEILRVYLKKEFSLLLNSDFLNILPGLVDGTSSYSMVKRQLELMIRA